MEKTKFDRVIGYCLKSPGKDIADPWVRLAAGMIKQALYDLLNSPQRKPNEEAMTWLKSEEAAFVCDGAGINYFRVRRLVDKVGSGISKNTRRLDTVKMTIYQFNRRGGTYQNRTREAA